MAIKHLINKLVAAGDMENNPARHGMLKLMAIFGILWIWSFCGLSSVPAVRAQNAANLAIDSPGATVNGNVVNFHTTSGLNDADWRYWWVVRGPRNQWTFAGPSGNLDLPPGDYRATVTARDRYGDTAYQDTSTFRVESPTVISTGGGRSAGNAGYRNDGRLYDNRVYNDGLYDRYGSRDNGYYDRYGDGYRNGGDYYPGGERYENGYGDGYYDGGYGNRYGDNRYYGTYGPTYDDGYNNVPYGDRYNGEYGGNLNGGSDNGYGEYSEYNMARYDGGQYGDGYYQDGGGHEGGPCDDGNLGSYDGGEYNY